MLETDLLEAYGYDLPEELIAQRPADPRDSSRLMVIHRSKGTWEHRVFRDLPTLLTSENILVANNSKVFKARLLGHRLVHGAIGQELSGKIELFLLRQIQGLHWEAIMKSSARQLPGFEFEIPVPGKRPLRGKITRGAKETEHGTVEVDLDQDPLSLDVGEVPIPHYIKRASGPEDVAQYQTMYAREVGSVAAPTAGFHFTSQVMEGLKARGIAWEEVTLHVGVGTFRTVREADIRNHRMHEEYFEISQKTAEHLNQAKASGKKILTIGTTATRTLEAAGASGVLKAGQGQTDIFIYPGGHTFRWADRMLTNFHLPKSSLLMLVSAFAGRDLIMAAYHEAIREKYRFFSYGDAMLILE